MRPQRLQVVVRKRAARQIEDAAEWWRANRQGGPQALADELERAFDLISQSPGVGVPAQSPRLRLVRRVLLPRVGYFIVYRVAPRRREVQVLAFRHARRG